MTDQFDGPAPTVGTGSDAGSPESVAEAVERTYRASFGRIVASLAHRFGDLDLAEEAAQEAFAEAIRRWPDDGVPPNPAGWLTVTARNRGLDRIRRESSRQARHAQAEVLYAPEDPLSPVTSIPDERLRLLFTCCHPALAPSAQVALTLRLLGGLTMAEVAAAFLLPERTVAQRITRAKRKIAAARIPYRVPRDGELPDRLRGVLATLYLIFNEGYLPRSGADAVRVDLNAEAIRLARVLRDLMPDEPEVAGLLGLMLLIDARRPARWADGLLLSLDEQDRARWDWSMVGEGQRLVRDCLRRNRPGHYQIMAAINAVHADARHFEDTDWHQIRALYDQLLRVTPTPVVALNRAIAVAETEDADAALALVDDLQLQDYQPWYVTRADLLHRAGRDAEATVAYGAAVRMTSNDAERAFLEGRMARLG